MPMRQIFAQLIKMKYKGSVNLEYEIKENDPLPGMQKSFSYMHDILAGLQAVGTPTRGAAALSGVGM